MLKYILKRILGMLPTLLLVTVVSYFIIVMAPGDPTDYLINPRTRPQDRQLMKENLGLNKPVIVQYGIWLKNLALHGDLGYSMVNGRPVLKSIVERIPATLALMGGAYILSLLISIPLGVISAVRQYSIWDYSLTFLAFIGLSMPSFWLALMAIYIFSLKLGWFPSSGICSIYSGPFFAKFLDFLKHLALPAAVLTVRNLADWTRYLRSSMLEVINEDYIRTARAKGLPENIVIYKHALRNALLPVITLIGLSLPILVAGAFVIEYIFGWPGMGQLGMNAVFHRDYPILMGDILLTSVLVLLGNLLADILYAWADPRIRY
ncbi:MAG: ABC transporter permease [Armatimonadota bacterium]